MNPEENPVGFGLPRHFGGRTRIAGGEAKFSSTIEHSRATSFSRLAASHEFPKDYNTTGTTTCLLSCSARSFVSLGLIADR